MRVLFTCVVGVGHFNPMVALAKAFESAGHRVAFATDPGFVDHVREVGFEAFPAGLDMPEARRRFAAQTPGLEKVPPWIWSGTSTSGCSGACGWRRCSTTSIGSSPAGSPTF